MKKEFLDLQKKVEIQNRVTNVAFEELKQQQEQQQKQQQQQQRGNFHVEAFRLPRQLPWVNPRRKMIQLILCRRRQNWRRTLKGSEKKKWNWTEQRRHWKYRWSNWQNCNRPWILKEHRMRTTLGKLLRLKEHQLRTTLGKLLTSYKDGG